MSKSGEHLGWIKKGDIFVEWKQYKQAIAAYDKAIKLKPNSIEAWKSKGKALMDAEEWDSAATAFEKVIKLDPLHVDGYLYGSGALEEGGQIEAARDCLDRARAALPDDPTPMFLKALFLLRQKEPAEALDLLNQAIAITPNTMYLMTRSIAYENLEQYEAAVAEYDRLLTIGESEIFWVNRAHILEKMERYDDALLSFSRALELTPDAAEIYYSIAICYATKGETEYAKANLEKAIALNPRAEEKAKTAPKLQALI
jgi:tetratricopeptide (TPR) repeat protein